VSSTKTFFPVAAVASGQTPRVGLVAAGNVHLQHQHHWFYASGSGHPAASCGCLDDDSDIDGIKVGLNEQWAECTSL
jgi:hypothetical protein